MRFAIWIAAAFSLALGACQTAGGGCPPLVDYSPEFQKQAAAEMRVLLPRGSAVGQMIVDYGKTRAACRVGEP